MMVVFLCPESPEVLQIARMLEERPELVVELCVRLWSWVSRNGKDGVVPNVRLADLQYGLRIPPQFLAILLDIGWIRYVEEEDCIVISEDFDKIVF